MRGKACWAPCSQLHAPGSNLYQRLREAIDALACQPRPHGCSKLSGSTHIYRVRVGDHRIIYQVADDRLLVLVIDIGHRREIYRT